MSKGNILKLNEKNLTRRYLVWCYKTTKEELDKVDRYFTQLKADEEILKQLAGHKDLKQADLKTRYAGKVEEFKKYMEIKKSNVLPKKYIDQRKNILQPSYCYLQNRFKAIEQTITRLLGAKALKEITALYEEEMTRRILEAREHS